MAEEGANEQTEGCVFVIYKIHLTNNLKPSLNLQSDSIRANTEFTLNISTFHLGPVTLHFRACLYEETLPLVRGLPSPFPRSLPPSAKSSFTVLRKAAPANGANNWLFRFHICSVCSGLSLVGKSKEPKYSRGKNVGSPQRVGSRSKHRTRESGGNPAYPRGGPYLIRE